MTYTSQQLSEFPWIASSDTLREEDLLPRFWGIADQIGATIPDTLLASLQRLVGEESSEADWDSELAAHACYELIELLCDAAPAGFYFGASEGDGACFGFWVTTGRPPWTQETWTVLYHCQGAGTAGSRPRYSDSQPPFG